MIGLRRSTARAALAAIMHGGFPWAPWPSADSGRLERRFRRQARRMMLARWPLPLRPVAAMAMGLAWPMMSLRDAVRDVRAITEEALGGRGRWRLALAAWGCALRSNVLPVEYYGFRLFEGTSGGVDSWLVGDELSRFNRTLMSEEALRLAQDKHAFWQFCETAGLPAVPTLARFAGGEAIEAFAEGALPPRDLVVKPRSGANGAGIEAWFHRDGAYFSAPGGLSESLSPLDADALEARLRSRSCREGELLVQPVLRPHPAVLALAGTGVPTIRIITGAWPNGRVAVMDALIQRPASDGFVSQGHRYALVEPETGRIRDDAPGQRDPVFPSYALDPAFRGLSVPDWEACRGAALAGHSAFPGPAPLLGWDMALTGQGPVLLETNVGLTFIQFQIANLRPALRGPMRTVIEAWL